MLFVLGYFAKKKNIFWVFPIKKASLIVSETTEWKGLKPALLIYPQFYVKAFPYNSNESNYTLWCNKTPFAAGNNCVTATTYYNKISCRHHAITNDPLLRTKIDLPADFLRSEELVKINLTPALRSLAEDIKWWRVCPFKYTAVLVQCSASDGACVRLNALHC